jgi:hypothetical protein
MSAASSWSEDKTITIRCCWTARSTTIRRDAKRSTLSGPNCPAWIYRFSGGIPDQTGARETRCPSERVTVVRVSVRRIKVAMASACPAAQVWGSRPSVPSACGCAFSATAATDQVGRSFLIIKTFDAHRNCRSDMKPGALQVRLRASRGQWAVWRSCGGPAPGCVDDNRPGVTVPPSYAPAAALFRN